MPSDFLQETGSKVTCIIIANELTYTQLPNRFASTSSESSVLEYMLDALWTVFDSIIILSPIEPKLEILEKVNPFGARFIMVQNKQFSEVLKTALETVQTPVILLLSGDRPLLKPSVLFHLSHEINEFPAVVPKWNDGKIEPFLASYKANTLRKTVRKRMNAKEFYDHVSILNDVLFLSVENEISTLDPELNSFIQIKGRQDREKITRLIDLKS